jgi:beta-alanine degradation protein BauB
MTTYLPMTLIEARIILGRAQDAIRILAEERMWLRFAGITILAILLVKNGGLAQDPMKAEPRHYKLAFENQHVQVVYIHYGPHERSSLHNHAAGVVVNISEAHLRLTDQDGKTLEIFSKPGEARWFPPLRREVENLNNLPYDGVYISTKDNSGH